MLESDLRYPIAGRTGSRNIIGCYRALTSSPGKSLQVSHQIGGHCPLQEIPKESASNLVQYLIEKSHLQYKCILTLSRTLGICKADRHFHRLLKNLWKTFNVKYPKAKGLLSLSDIWGRKLVWEAMTLRSGDLGSSSTHATTNGVKLAPAVSWIVSLQMMLES